MIEVRGADQLTRLSKNLKDAGRRDLERELSKGISRALKPVIASLRASAQTTLPHRGGLAARVAGSQMSISGHKQGLRLTAKNAYALAQLDKGTVRHPVYGNREAWVTQKVDRGWWTRPTEAAGPRARREAQQAMDRVAREIGRGV